MSLSEIDLNSVIKAAQEFDQLGRDAFLQQNGFGASRSYFLKLDGKLYDSKAIVGVAHGFVSPTHKRLRSKDFSGGEATVEALLTSLGLEVVRADGSAPPADHYFPGTVYHRKRDIHDPHGGQEQGGISTPKSSPYVFLFTAEAGAQHGYSDGWSNGLFLYTGAGQVGDMQMTSGNKAILAHRDLGKTIVLFQATKKKGEYLCVGDFECVGWREGMGPDREGTNRTTIVFELLPVDAEHQSEAPKSKVGSPTASLPEMRKKAYQSATVGKTKTRSAVEIYARSEAVRAYVRARASGTCEACKQPAPFVSKTGEPYLEPHHIDRLADGGLDKPNVVGAICPACHREIHHGLNGSSINSKLREYVQELEADAENG